MRVAIVVEWLDAARGGAETSTLQFMDRLMARGVSLEVFTRSALPSTPMMTVRSIATAASTRARATGEFLDKVERAIDGADYDIVHAFIPCNGANVYQPRGGTVAETIQRTIASRRTPASRAFKRLTLALNARQRLVSAKERAWLTGQDRPIVIAISEYVARQLRSHYRFPETHIRHSLNGVDAHPGSPAVRAADRSRIRADYAVAENELLLLQVCHNFRLKGVGRLIDAMSLARRRGGQPMKALVVGRDNPHPWRRLAKRLGVDGDVHFTGPKDNVAAFLHAADVLVHPTYYDPCSRVVLEAVVFGVPVVCTRYDGASEVLEDGVSGFVLDSPDSTDLLADRIGMLADATVRQRLSEAARSASAGVTMVRHADEVLLVYEGLAGGARAEFGRRRSSSSRRVCPRNHL